MIGGLWSNADSRNDMVHVVNFDFLYLIEKRFYDNLFSSIFDCAFSG